MSKGEKGHCLVAAAGGEVLLLEHGDYRGSVPADGGAPITCLLGLTKAGYSILSEVENVSLAVQIRRVCSN